MKNCPRYLTCSAPVCALDPDWRKRCHLPGERVCLWLTEFAKPSGSERIRLVLTEEQAQRVAEAYPNVLSRSSIIRNALQQASVTGSRLDQWMRSGRRLSSEGEGIGPR